MTFLRKQFARTFIALFIVMLGFMAYEEAKAQTPVTCTPCNYRPPGYSVIYNWCYTWAYAWLAQVTLTEVGGPIAIDRTSNFDGNYYYTNVTGIVNMGSDYEIYGLRHFRYTWNSYSMLKVWIDYNQDGDFDDPGEKIGAWRDGYHRAPFENRGYFTIPTDVPAGKTHMRVIGSYYTYDYGPCVNGYRYAWGNYFYNYGYYGECEDYIIDIQAGVKDTYPTTGDILFAGEDYDGNGRDKDGTWYDFKKPALIFNADNKAGTRAEFYIFGPMPYEDIVYEGLEAYPSTSTWFDVSGPGSQYYSIKQARGDYAYPKTPFSDGTFNASSGGTYKVYAYQEDSPLPKRNSFTVSWEDDLTVASIVSPRTNEAPNFFKYVQGQTIRVRARAQNVGLNDVTEFYVICRIWDPDGVQVYRDSVYYSAPPSEVLSTSETAELEFTDTRYTRTGVYKIQFDSYLLSGTDQDDFNNHFARATDPEYTFEVAYEFQLQANELSDHRLIQL